MYSLHRILLADLGDVAENMGEGGELLKALRMGQPEALQEVVTTLRAQAGVTDDDTHAEADRLERLGMGHLSTTSNLFWCLPRVWQCLVQRLCELCGGAGSRGTAKAEHLLGVFSNEITSFRCSSAMEAHHCTYASILRTWLTEVIIK